MQASPVQNPGQGIGNAISDRLLMEFFEKPY